MGPGSRLGNIDAARPAFRSFGYDDRENAVPKVGADALDLHGRGKREGPREFSMAAFDLMILLARDAGIAAALQRDAAVLDFNPDLVAGEAG